MEAPILKDLQNIIITAMNHFAKEPPEFINNKEAMLASDLMELLARTEAVWDTFAKHPIKYSAFKNYATNAAAYTNKLLHIMNNEYHHIFVKVKVNKADKVKAKLPKQFELDAGAVENTKADIVTMLVHVPKDIKRSKAIKVLESIKHVHIESKK